MTGRLLYVLAGALLGLATQLAGAEEITAADFELQSTRELLQVCTTEESSGYMLGVAHFHEAATGEDIPPLTCPPQDLSLLELARTFVMWADENRADGALMGELPVDGVIRAAAAKWPCKSS
jgi:hypothetical protein